MSVLDSHDKAIKELLERNEETGDINEAGVKRLNQLRQLENAPSYEALQADLSKALEALEFYQNKHTEYLANGGLFNSWLMNLTGDKLAEFFTPAIEALKEIKERVK